MHKDGSAGKGVGEKMYDGQGWTGRKRGEGKMHDRARTDGRVGKDGREDA